MIDACRAKLLNSHGWLRHCFDKGRPESTSFVRLFPSVQSARKREDSIVSFIFLRVSTSALAVPSPLPLIGLERSKKRLLPLGCGLWIDFQYKTNTSRRGRRILTRVILPFCRSCNMGQLLPPPFLLPCSVTANCSVTMVSFLCSVSAIVLFILHSTATSTFD